MPNRLKKAMIGLEIAPHLEAAAKQRQIEGGERAGRGRPQKAVPTVRQPKAKRAPRVVDQIAKAAGIAHGNVSKAKKVRDASPALAASVAAGTSG